MTTDPSRAVDLRAPNDSDTPFLRRLFESTLPPSLSVVALPEGPREQLVTLMMRGQQQTWDAAWPRSERRLVIVDGAPVGQLWIADTDEGLRLVDITLLPEIRGRGLGAVLLRNLLARARAEGRPVLASVTASNPAIRLYERLGFRSAGGGNGVHLPIRWDPEGLPPEREKAEPGGDSAELAAFRAALGGEFLADVDGDPIRLVLVEAAARPHKSQGDASAPRAPFSLLFRGPPGAPSEQRTWKLRNEAFGTVELFLVPVGQRPDGGLDYEAIFA